MKKNLKTISYWLSIMVVSLFVGYSMGFVSAWSEPSGPAPGGNISGPLTTGSVGQSKTGGLVLNTGGAANGLIVQYGNVGIGTTNPTAKLYVTTDGNAAYFVTTNPAGYAGYFSGGHGIVEICPGGFTLIMPSTSLTGERSLGCMQTNERSVNTWSNAAEDCFDTYGGRLPTPNELTVAFNNFSLANETDDYEWTSDGYYVWEGTPGMAHITVSGSALGGQFDTVATTPYRCWIDR